VLTADRVDGVVFAGAPSERSPGDRKPRFAVGEAVCTRNRHPRGHTRLPRYARGRVGVIWRIHGCHVFPDSNAMGGGEDPQFLYGVRFSAAELWGEDAEAPGDSLCLDLWEPYLERP